MIFLGDLSHDGMIQSCDIHLRGSRKVRVIGTMHMIIGQFFKVSSSFDILEELEIISGSQMDLENDILMVHLTIYI